MPLSKDDVCYGIEGAEWERLETSEEDAVERFVGDIGDSLDEALDSIAWPIRVQHFKRMDVGGEPAAQRIADDAIERQLEILDDEYGDPDGDYSEPTDRMKAAALAFGNAVVADYVSWACEPSGEVTEWTREMVRKLLARKEPATDQ